MTSIRRRLVLMPLLVAAVGLYLPCARKTVRTRAVL